MVEPVTLITAAMSLAKAVPSIARLFGGEKTAENAEKVLDVAKSITGIDDDQAAAEAVAESTELQIKLHETLQPLLIAEMEAHTRRLAEVNQTMRAELASGNAFRAGWRPFFGYCVAVTWVIQMVGMVVAFAYAITTDPAQAGTIINAIAAAIGALTAMWGMALAVLGISVHKRSEDKKIAAGLKPAAGTLMQAIAGRISGKNDGG